ncbi:MAG: biotin/lipoyl-binding protein [Patescibacteria group bacterium]|nr:biotin/lipoyl-binding protein [Patescibacteria group bacterium]
MKQHIKTLHHHPKRVIIISLTIALIIGFLGYLAISKSRNFTPSDNSALINPNENSPSVRNLTLGFLAAGRIKSVSVKAGDVVKKGQVLATLDAGNVVGALDQAKASYAIAQANYQKIINGATGPTIDVAKATVNTAKVSLNEITKQQEVLVNNAYKSLLNSSIQAVAVSDYGAITAPVITGTYDCSNEGVYNLNTYTSSNGTSVYYTGLETGSVLSTNAPKAIGTCGLFLSYPSSAGILTPVAQFVIQIPNKSAANYTSNLNAYQLALQNKEQAIAGAQATLDQANANLTSIVTTARPEDVATAQAQMENANGALKIAQAAYDNTIIVAPADGTVTSVAITPGQIAVPNASAIEFISNSSSN